MFYCDNCQKENNWPKSIMRHYGPCEQCGVQSNCNEVKSDLLPDKGSVNPYTGELSKVLVDWFEVLRNRETNS
jgi:hypothetical protein